MNSMYNNRCIVNLLSIFVLCFLWTDQVLVVNGQYESPNHLCGGWFHSTNGSIRFNYTGSTNDPEFADKPNQVCVWTINPGLPAQHTGFTIRAQKLENLTCTNDNRVTINHFNLRSKEVTASETWNCGGPQQWVNVPGTVIVVVLSSANLTNGTGFLLEWSESGSWMNRTGLRTMYYSWGKYSVEPLPYFAAGFNRNEIATFAFSKGNGTTGYKLEMTFDNLKFCPNAGIPDNQCLGNIVAVFGIRMDGGIDQKPLALYQENQVSPSAISSPGGLFILVWIADSYGSGASFQLKYNSVRE